MYLLNYLFDNVKLSVFLVLKNEENILTNEYIWSVCMHVLAQKQV